MDIDHRILIVGLAIWGQITSCSTLEKASSHGLHSGKYGYSQGKGKGEQVYLDVEEEKIDVYRYNDGKVEQPGFLTIDLASADVREMPAMVFKKQSLDIDITSILLKYRPSVNGLPTQVNADLNMALYAGWRFDRYYISTQKDVLGKTRIKARSRGFDFGVFAGPGSTTVNPFNTLDRIDYEYNGMVIQGGIAGFLESSIASFGIAAGFDYLLGRDRQIWVYNGKPWIGFIVGIALN